MPRFICLLVLLVNQLDETSTAVLLNFLAVFTDKDGLVLVECIFEVADATEECGTDDKPADAKGTGGFPIDCILPLLMSISN